MDQTMKLLAKACILSTCIILCSAQNQTTNNAAFTNSLLNINVQETNTTTASNLTLPAGSLQDALSQTHTVNTSTTSPSPQLPLNNTVGNDTARLPSNVCNLLPETMKDYEGWNCDNKSLCLHKCHRGYGFSDYTRRKYIYCINNEWNITEFCEPLCKPKCVHGKCVAPETCKCIKGYEGEACEYEFIPCEPAEVLDEYRGSISVYKSVSVLECHDDHLSKNGNLDVMMKCVRGKWTSKEPLQCYPQCTVNCTHGTVCAGANNLCACAVDWRTCPKNCTTLEQAKVIERDRMLKEINKTVCIPKGTTVITNYNKLIYNLNCYNGSWQAQIDGIECKRTCVPSCRNNGFCNDKQVCECTDNYFGDHCQYRKCDDPPYGVLNGQMRVGTQQSTLSCMDNFMFRMNLNELKFTCRNEEWIPPLNYTIERYPICWPVCVPPCLNGGRCVAPDKCKCPEGFTGKYCDYKYSEGQKGRCIFPFKFLGQMYYSCTLSGAYDSTPWCARSVNQALEVTEKMPCYGEIGYGRYIITHTKKTCMFPFTHDDYLYTDCVSNEGNYCATHTSQGEMVEKGVCNKDKGLEHIIYTTTGATCILPFKYNGKTYNSCVRNSTQSNKMTTMWCPTIIQNNTIIKTGSCILDYGPFTTTYTITGKTCIFPYQYLFVTYTRCTSLKLGEMRSCPTRIVGNKPTDFEECLQDDFIGYENNQRYLTSANFSTLSAGSNSSSIVQTNNNFVLMSVLSINSLAGHRCIFPIRLDDKIVNTCQGYDSIPSLCVTRVDNDGAMVRSKEQCRNNLEHYFYYIKKLRIACYDHMSIKSFSYCLRLFMQEIDRGIWKDMYIYTQAYHIYNYTQYKNYLAASNVHEWENRRNPVFLHFLTVMNSLVEPELVSKLKFTHLLEYQLILNKASALGSINLGVDDPSYHLLHSVGEACVPFILNGVYHGWYSCILFYTPDSALPWSTAKGVTWCATKTNQNLAPLMRTSCSRRVNTGISYVGEKSGNTVEVETQNNMLCKFPFKHGKKIYRDKCAMGIGGSSWCATSTDSLFNVVTYDLCSYSSITTMTSVQAMTYIGYNCIFPYHHHGKTYTDCSYKRLEKTPGTCAVQVDQNNNAKVFGTCSGLQYNSYHIMTVKGFRCHFPFIHKGVNYSSCVTTSKYDPGWCAIKVDDDNEVIMKDTCSPYTNKKLRRIITINNNICEFPFIEDGIKYVDSCVNASKYSAGWCYVKIAEHRKKEVCKSDSDAVLYGENGRRCQFPIHFKGRIYYNECVRESAFDVGWCLTYPIIGSRTLERTPCRGTYGWLTTPTGDTCKLPFQMDHKTTLMDSCIKEGKFSRGTCYSYHNNTRQPCSPFYTRQKVTGISGDKCIFPFIYNNKKYTRSCVITSLYDDGFCAKQVDQNGVLIEKQSCSKTKGASARIVTVTGKKCVLPYMFNGTKYEDGCFYHEEDNMFKCPTAVDSDLRIMESEECVSTLAMDLAHPTEAGSCIFPFLDGSTLYQRSCKRVSDYDPGWCIALVKGSKERAECAARSGYIRYQYSIDGRVCKFPMKFKDGQLSADQCEGASDSHPGYCNVFDAPTGTYTRAQCIKQEVEEAKSVSEKKCIFPFKHNDITYFRTCYRSSDYFKGWCVTGIKENGTYVTEECAKSRFITLELQTVTGKTCLLPFTYKGQTYVDSCMNNKDNDFDVAGWCATKLNNGEVAEFEKCLQIRTNDVKPQLSNPTDLSISGKLCVPFMYNNTYRTSCVVDTFFENGWCATQVDQKKNYVSIENCKLNADTWAINTMNGHSCTFPFKVNENIFVDDCVREEGSLPWCIYTDNKTDVCITYKKNYRSALTITTTTTITPTTMTPSTSTTTHPTISTSPPVSATFEVELDQPTTRLYSRPYEVTVDGKKCIIPFYYNNVLQLDCIEHPAWCPTKLVANRIVEAGYCNRGSSISNYYPSVRYPIIFGTLGHKCIIPFYYKSRLYTHCTTIDAHVPWCVVKQDSELRPLKGEQCVLERFEHPHLSSMTVSYPIVIANNHELCQFPFHYKEAWFSNCVWDNGFNASVCATKVNGEKRATEIQKCQRRLESLMTDKQKPCVFPFTYKNKVYTTCVKDPQTGREWCPIYKVKEVPSCPIRREKLIGNCSPSSQLENLLYNRCIFPFKYNGKIYRSGITLQGKQVCATQLDTRGNAIAIEKCCPIKNTIC